LTFEKEKPPRPTNKEKRRRRVFRCGWLGTGGGQLENWRSELGNRNWNWSLELEFELQMANGEWEMANSERAIAKWKLKAEMWKLRAEHWRLRTANCKFTAKREANR